MEKDSWSERPLDWTKPALLALRAFLVGEFPSELAMQMLMDEAGVGDEMHFIRGERAEVLWHANIKAISRKQGSLKKLVDSLTKRGFKMPM